MPEPKTPNQNFPRLTMQQAKEEMACFQKIYPLVRLVDLKTLATQPCYAPWKGRAPCRNCIGREALNCKGKKSKIEYLGSKAYQATAIYVEVDGVPYVMEMIQPLDADSPLTPNEVYELYRDVTTSAYNRRYYEDHLRRQHMAAGVAVIDLDDFKLYNDTFGHHAGDVALETTAHTIQECIRDSDMLIRYGGDELLLVLPDISGDDFVRKLRQIGLLIHEAVVPGYDKLQLSASIGGVLSAGRTIDEAFKEADKLMYQAKLQKNTVVTDHDCNVQPESTIHPRRSQQQILIVDDSEMNRMILSEMLKGEFEILEAENGSACLDMLNRYETKISLILLDIVMPGMNGFGVLEYMNRNNLIGDIPVIMISGEDSGEVIKQAYEWGVSDYIKRPFDMEVVHRRVLNTIKLYAKQRRLVAMVTNQVFEKEKNSRMLISVLSEIVEFRNGESGMHVLNINILTTMILEQLVKKTDKYPLSWSNRMLISTASSLHDIGKIGIDEKILNKPGRLTPEERKIMEKHTVIGADMLANLQMYEDEPLMKVAYQICRWHHERYDGKGYPDGLKGEEIPISAQVVALADVYDALTSERVYKKAYSHEEAVQMICNGECGTFNPLLLECLCEIQDPIKKELQEAAYRSEMSDPERKNKKFEHYDNSQKKFFGAVTQAIEKEYGTAGEELSRMKTEEEK